MSFFHGILKVVPNGVRFMIGAELLSEHAWGNTTSVVHN